MKAAVIIMIIQGIILGIILGYRIGAEYPPCVPGAVRLCEGTIDSVQYCTEHGFGWEPCQSLRSPIYPQALWRKNGPK